MDKPFKDIANSLNISVGTVYNVYRLFQETGEVSPKTPYKRYDIRKLDYYHENYILCLYLSEIVMKVFGVSVSISTVCRLLAKHGFTRKKVKQVALQRNCEFRGAFIANMSLYGYAFRGQRAEVHRLLVRGKRKISPPFPNIPPTCFK